MSTTHLLVLFLAVVVLATASLADHHKPPRHGLEPPTPIHKPPSEHELAAVVEDGGKPPKGKKPPPKHKPPTPQDTDRDHKKPMPNPGPTPEHIPPKGEKPEKGGPGHDDKPPFHGHPPKVNAQNAHKTTQRKLGSN